MKDGNKRNICLTIAYDGTDFHGYQRQNNASSIQRWIEQGLSKIYNTPITLYGAARTDAGVHARGQVANFYAEGPIPVDKIPYAMKAYLPPEIAVLKAQIMPDDFNVRRNNIGKLYRYTIVNQPVHDPFLLRYAWFIRKPLDREAMKKGAEVLLGTHDFSSFEGQNTTPMNPVKTLYRVRFHDRGSFLSIDVIGNGFLYHMVRNIAGALVDVGLGRMTAERLREIRDEKNRRLLGATAPAKGLCLEKVFYSEETLQEAISEEYYKN